MLFTETGGGNSGNDGAYVRAAIRLLDNANKTKYQALVNSLHITMTSLMEARLVKPWKRLTFTFLAIPPCRQ